MTVAMRLSDCITSVVISPAPHTRWWRTEAAAQQVGSPQRSQHKTEETETTQKLFLLTDPWCHGFSCEGFCYLVSLVAEVTGPQFGSVVHLAETHRHTGVTQAGLSQDRWVLDRCLPERVEHSAAGCTAAENWFILDRRQVRSLLQGGEQYCHRYHHPGRFQAAGRPHVPAETHTIPLFVLSDVLWEGRHGNGGRNCG